MNLLHSSRTPALRVDPLRFIHSSGASAHAGPCPHVGPALPKKRRDHRALKFSSFIIVCHHAARPHRFKRSAGACTSRGKYSHAAGLSNMSMVMGPRRGHVEVSRAAHALAAARSWIAIAVGAVVVVHPIATQNMGHIWAAGYPSLSSVVGCRRP